MIRFEAHPTFEQFMLAWRRRTGASERVSIRDAAVRARAVVRALDDALMEAEIEAARAETAPADLVGPTRATGTRSGLRATLVTLRGDLRQLDATAADEARQAHEWTRRARMALEEGRADLAEIARVRGREHERFAEALADEAHEVARTVEQLERLLAESAPHP